MTLTDVIVSARFLDERQVTGLLKPSAPQLSLMEGGGSGSSPAGTYLRLGITHILSGFDHLLFVAGLVLLVSMRQLLPVVTSFTLAHSLTLGLSALGWVSLPPAPRRDTHYALHCLARCRDCSETAGPSGAGGAQALAHRVWLWPLAWLWLCQCAWRHWPATKALNSARFSCSIWGLRLAKFCLLVLC